MKKMFIFAVLLASIFFITQASASTFNLSNCSTLNNSNAIYNLLNDINDTGTTCLEIPAGADNITINGAGHTVIYSGTQIVSFGTIENLTVKNLTFKAEDTTTYTLLAGTNNQNVTSINVNYLNVVSGFSSSGSVKLILSNAYTYSPLDNGDTFITADILHDSIISNVSIYMQPNFKYGLVYAGTEVRNTTFRNITFLSSGVDNVVYPLIYISKLNESTPGWNSWIIYEDDIHFYPYGVAINQLHNYSLGALDNVSAIVTLSGVDTMHTYILNGDAQCTDCHVISQQGNAVTFSIEHSGDYHLGSVQDLYLAAERASGGSSVGLGSIMQGFGAGVAKFLLYLAVPLAIFLILFSIIAAFGIIYRTIIQAVQHPVEHFSK